MGVTAVHENGSPPGCVDCHMPSRDYMVIDGRRDHSFRVPRPDLAEVLGVTERTVQRDWVFARAWLERDLSGR